MIKRRKTRVINVGGVKIGGNNPIAIQSMTKVKTSDMGRIIPQIKRLERSGCELIRVSVKDLHDAKAIRRIRERISIPVIADIHFDYRLAIESIKNGADKIRINPGNMSDPLDLKEVIRAARKRKCPIRIGLNSGSIKGTKKTADQKDVFVKCALRFIKLFERENFRDIILSLKSSNILDTIEAYRRLGVLCDYPFHLGVTAAGPYDSGIIKSSIGIGCLLLDGIGDTIRVSITGEPEVEVIAAKKILQALDIRRFTPDLISCPTCGRCQVDLVSVVKDLEKKLYAERSTFNIGRLPRIAVMGCEVNGPGEAKEADVGIAFGKDAGVIFKKGKIVKKVKAKNAVKELLRQMK